MSVLTVVHPFKHIYSLPPVHRPKGVLLVKIVFCNNSLAFDLLKLSVRHSKHITNHAVRVNIVKSISR